MKSDFRYWLHLVESTSLFENYRFISRSRHGDISADELMQDVHNSKALYKLGTANRYNAEQILVMQAEEDDPRCILWLSYGNEARVHEKYESEAGPIIKYLINKWPAYAKFIDEDTGLALAELTTRRVTPAAVKLWYHGTSSVKLPTIERFGLQPQDVSQRQYRGMGGSKEGLVYLTSDINTAAFHAENSVKHFGGAPVILKIDISGLENQIRTDHDVKHTALGRDDWTSGSATDYRRIKRTPGQGSFLTIQTIAFAGRIPANRISIRFRGKETKRPPRIETKNEQYTFVNALGDAAQKLPDANKDAFFKIIGAGNSGSTGRTLTYPPKYYESTKQLVNSVHSGKSQPARYASWIRGMYARSRRWRGHYDPGYSAIGAIIAAEYERLRA